PLFLDMPNRSTSWLTTILPVRSMKDRTIDSSCRAILAASAIVHTCQYCWRISCASNMAFPERIAIPAMPKGRAGVQPERESGKFREASRSAACTAFPERPTGLQHRTAHCHHAFAAGEFSQPGDIVDRDDVLPGPHAEALQSLERTGEALGL